MKKQQREPRQIPHRCPHCGRWFYMARTGRPKIYCSVECRVGFWRDEQKKLAAEARESGVVL